MDEGVGKCLRWMMGIGRIAVSGTSFDAVYIDGWRGNSVYLHLFLQPSIHIYDARRSTLCTLHSTLQQMSVFPPCRVDALVDKAASPFPLLKYLRRYITTTTATPLQRSRMEFCPRGLGQRGGWVRMTLTGRDFLD